jgi:serine/threonine protein kinase
VAPEIPGLPGLTDLSPVGRGGFADVYLARQAHLDRFVAAKVFRVTLADRNADDQSRAECQAVGRSDGRPNVITVHDANVPRITNLFVPLVRRQRACTKLVSAAI